MVGGKEVVAVILGMAAVTFALRVSPLWFLAQRPLPAALKRWLDSVPVAVLGALVTVELFTNQGQLALASRVPYLLAAIPSLLVAWRTRGIVGAVLAGMATLAVGRAFLGWG